MVTKSTEQPLSDSAMVNADRCSLSIPHRSHAGTHSGVARGGPYVPGRRVEGAPK